MTTSDGYFDGGDSASRADRGISEVHHTEDGQIHLWASPDKEGGWRGRFWGTQLAGAQHFKTVEEANAFLQRSFREMFPEHVCAAACGTSEDVAQRRAAEEMNFHDY